MSRFRWEHRPRTPTLLDVARQHCPKIAERIMADQERELRKKKAKAAKPDGKLIRDSHELFMQARTRSTVASMFENSGMYDDAAVSALQAAALEALAEEKSKIERRADNGVDNQLGRALSALGLLEEKDGD